MLFNSFGFIPFLLSVYILYWFVLNKNLRIQNVFLLVVSYFFYSFWDWRFLFLLILSTLIDYSFGLIIFKSVRRKKLFLWLSIFNNLAILGFFKYYNFFAVSIQSALGLTGLHFDPWLINIVLPVGISFYTFHGMSYVFDIYNGKVEPRRNFVEYAVFVCFFPLLVSGPIERATHLLPQVGKKRVFSYQQSIEGLRLILWGYFLKVVIADTLSGFVNDIFKNYKTYPGSVLALGAIYFSIQIYGDFCGYTNIAIGVAKLFGFELLSNFRYPYFSRNIAEFWRRWHISLSSWFRDYLYIPLGGARVGKVKAIRNVFIIFVVSGFWHGANWTFILWGAIHAALFIPLLLAKRNRAYTSEIVAESRRLPGIKEAFQMTATFCLVSIAWIFFRAPSVAFACNYIAHMFSSFKIVSTHRLGLIYVIIPLLIDWQQRRSERNVLNIKNSVLRWGMYVFLGTCVLFYSSYNQAPFIYFQF
jgi:alginate O-acetyltransferase complex protein AlgI